MIKDNANCIANLPFPNPSLDLAFWKTANLFYWLIFLIKKNENWIYASPAQIKGFFNANFNFNLFKENGD
jgi:hypothetical protein